MNTRIRYAAYSLAGISIVLTLLLGYPEVNRSRAKAHSNAPVAELRTGTVVEGGTATLSPANLKTWKHAYTWYHPERPYCGAPFKRGDSAQEIAGSITAGYWHRYDSGAQVFSCPDGVNSVSRGTVWFDLSEIMSKAPPLHVSVQTATLHFKQLPVPPIFSTLSKPTGDCPGELLVGTADWLTGYEDNALVPGDPIATLGSCGSEGCDFNVQAAVNNWLKGADHGGYANYGFVFKGMQEADLKYEDNHFCAMRYSDFSLTVNYTYDKETVKSVPDSYPLVCRGTEALKIRDFDGPVGFRWVGFNFIPGTGPAKNGLRPGECSWVDRAMRPGEPGRLAQPIEKTQVWNKELDSPDSYWTFNVYNAGDQLQATGAERSTKPSIDVAKPGASIPGGDSTTFAKTNYALTSNGGVASASSTTKPWEASYVNDGDLTTDVDRGVWLDGTFGAFPDSIQIEFTKGAKRIDEIVVVTRQDDLKSTATPAETMPFSLYGITDFEVQYWDGKWITVPGGSVTGNNLVWRRFTFPKVITDKIRVFITGSKDNGYSRIIELQALGN